MVSRTLQSIAVAGLCLSTPLSGFAEVDFVSEVRPILSDNCFKCHGPDEDSRKSELRLDIFKGATAEAKSGMAAIIPGQPDDSELIARVTTSDEDDLMPPHDTGKTLTTDQINTLKQWIAEGAKYDTHWAFKPVTHPELPSPRHQSWIKNPIDAFVLAKLEKEGMNPSPEAGKVTLLRRLHLDLIGLPPTIEQVDDFLAHDSPDAYNKVVDQLLDSPHYGERWGRLWLDAARYADSDGFEKDKPRDVWVYRDYVVNSLNEDKPYDQFVIEQIAGDLLAARNDYPPEIVQEMNVATGFLRNSMVNEEGGVHPEQFRMEAMFDRMDAIGKSMLGLTIQCAQCHTHKYDPITQKNYYQMFSFINDSAEGSMVTYSPDVLQKRAAIFERGSMIEEDLKHRTPDWAQQLEAWEQSVKETQPDWQVVKATNSGDNAQRYYPREDGSQVASGYAPTRWTATFTNTVDAADIRAFRLELMTDENLPSKGPGRSLEGTFALTEFKVEAQDVENPAHKVWASFETAVADFSNETMETSAVLQAGFKEKRVTGPVEWAIDGKDETAWGGDAGPGIRNQDHTAVFVASTNIAFPKGTKLTFHLRQNHGGPNSDQNQNLNLGRFRLSIAGGFAEEVTPIPNRIQQILDTPKVDRTRAQQADLFTFWRERVPAWNDANKQIAALWRTHPEGSTQLVLSQMETPRETHLLKRGDQFKPGQAVLPGVPEVLNPLPASEKPDRLTFAKWMVDRNSPTTARSIVNRIWQAYFGIGIVETAEDLGTQSPPPSHRELLDWLAVELMEPGVNAESGIRTSELRPWSLKHLHRLIVNSATYRQSSRVTDALYAKDPYNRLLARGARFRVDAEIVRDIALAASGLLNDEVGGPSVFPAAPRFLFDPPASYGPKFWGDSTGDERYRRAFYTFRYRSIPYPALQAYDAPTGDFACVRRSRSNTPLQALTSLNETVFMECAQALARETLAARGTDEERAEYAFRRCVSRKPEPAEKAELLALLNKQRSHIAEGWIDIPALAGAGTSELPAGTTPTQLAAWTTVSRVLLNLDETITKE